MKRILALAACLFSLVTSFSLAQNTSKGWGPAMWVWDHADAHQVAQTNDPRFLRKTFELKAKPTSAELWVTADNRYVAFVNGQKVGAGSDWSKVEKIDVAKHLVVGKNVLAIEVRNEGGVAGAIARLHVKTADQKEQFIVTDATMKITQAVAKDWTAVAFDDSSWFAAIVLGDTSLAPWSLSSSAAAPGGKSIDVGAVDPKIKTRLTAEMQLKHFTFPEGFTLELVAADPLVINPITMASDEKGRIYVSESHTYRFGPSGSPIKPFANPVIRLDPTADGKMKRTLVADGFDDPVMGIAIKEGKLWLTANNYLYRYDLADDGKATNKEKILVDKNKAWNPFGMFVIEWGPDGQLLMSVGDHQIDIQGPDGKISGRKNSGIVMRMNADGTKMQRLVHGLRVPYSFEYDPYGQLWLLSNGEGNPNRFVRVIDGVDYHCYSRPNVDNNWLAGNHPLAPPVFELPRGAHTQLMRYYGAAFPEKYQGNLFLCNWGAHGFTGSNRAIFRFVPNEDGSIGVKESLLSCTDPHFRPSHIMLDPEGNLLVSDWYGRDDESDMTGRVWRLKYVGKDGAGKTRKPFEATAKLGAVTLSDLGSPDHLAREHATKVLIGQGNAAVMHLADYAAKSTEPLGAASALWSLLRIGTPEAKKAIAAGAQNADPKVRRLSLNLLRRHAIDGASDMAMSLAKDADPAVRVEAAITLTDSTSLLDALASGAAKNEHLRYEAAWHLAKHGDAAAFSKALASDDADVRLAGMIAVDVACFEEFKSKPAALIALGKTLENPGKIDPTLLLMLVQLDGDKSIVPSLEKFIGREELPIGVTAKAILLLKAKSGGASKVLSAAAGKRLIEAVEKGALRVATPADQLMIFEFLEAEGPTPFALKQIAGQFRSPQPALRQAAHTLARRFGPKSASLAEPLWASVLAPKSKLDDTVEQLSTLARIESAPKKEAWTKLLAHDDPLVRAEAVRWWRSFKDRPEMVDVLAQQAPELVKTDAGLKDDLAAVFRHLDKQPESIKALSLPREEKDKAVWTKQATDDFAKLSPADKSKHAALGLQVFERSGCTKCHTTATVTTPLAPSLKGIGTQKIDYLIESVLYPSKIIKTGFETETVVDKNGIVRSGLVKEDGKFLKVLNVDTEARIAKEDVEMRSVSRVSIMPEGQEAQMSRREFLDLIAYLATLK